MKEKKEDAEHFVRIMSCIVTMTKNGVYLCNAIKVAFSDQEMKLLKTVTE